MLITINYSSFLDLATRLLDDEHGISESAWSTLKQMLFEANCKTLISRVISSEGRFFLPKVGDDGDSA